VLLCLVFSRRRALAAKRATLEIITAGFSQFSLLPLEGELATNVGSPDLDDWPARPRCCLFWQVYRAYLGARSGGLTHWEGLAMGSGMNARGAMEIIVATIGLSLGYSTSRCTRLSSW